MWFSFSRASMMMKRLPGGGALIRFLLSEARSVVGGHHSQRVCSRLPIWWDDPRWIVGGFHS